MNNMPRIEGMSLIDKTQLKDAIDDFNKKYAQYMSDVIVLLKTRIMS